MNMKFTMACLLAGTMFTTALKAQEEKKEVPLSISGQVDAYYRYSSSEVGGLTSYTPAARSFGLGMANLVASKDLGKVSFTADLMFGPRAEATNYSYAGNSLAYIKQLYVSYKPTEKLKFTLGNFMTFVGYELVEASNNLNYSMSYNYTNGPFFHTGIKADYAINDNWSAMVGVFDQTDSKGITGNKFVGGQIGYVKGGFKLYLNALAGKGLDSLESMNTTLDLTASYQVTPKFGLGLNIIDKMVKVPEQDGTSFLGIAAYANFAVSDKFTLAARGEYFDDADAVALLGSKIKALTVSGNIKIDAFTIIPEVRFDAGDVALWGGKKSDVSFLLAGVFKF